MTTYTLTLTEAQAQTLSIACEVLARLGMGQYKDALDNLPQRDGIDWDAWHDDMRGIGYILSKHMPGIDGYISHIGIRKAAQESRLAWDLHQVIRHRLAWDRAVARGVTDGTVRNWNEMLGCNYDEPCRTCEAPLARMEAVR